jgi:hypothetical protein
MSCFLTGWFALLAHHHLRHGGETLKSLTLRYCALALRGRDFIARLRDFANLWLMITQHSVAVRHCSITQRLHRASPGVRTEVGSSRIKLLLCEVKLLQNFQLLLCPAAVGHGHIRGTLKGLSA